MFVKNIITSKNIMGFLTKVAASVEKYPLRAAAATSASLGVVLGIVVSKLVNKCDCGEEIRPANSTPNIEDELKKAKTNTESAEANSILVADCINKNDYKNIITFGELWQNNLKLAGDAIFAVKNSPNATANQKTVVKTYEERLYSMDSKARDAILDAKDTLNAAAALAAADARDAARDADRAAAAKTATDKAVADKAATDKAVADKAVADKAASDAAAKEKAKQPAVAEKAAPAPPTVRRFNNGMPEQPAAEQPAVAEKAAPAPPTVRRFNNGGSEQPAVAEKAAAGSTPVRRITAADRDAAAKEKAEQDAAAEAKETDEGNADAATDEDMDFTPSWQKIKRKLYN